MPDRRGAVDSPTRPRPTIAASGLANPGRSTRDRDERIVARGLNALAAGPDGQAKVKLTFWRRQRRPIPPEPGPWTDIGKLGYRANIQSVGAADVPPTHRLCPASAYSDSDPNLAPPAAAPTVEASRT